MNETPEKKIIRDTDTDSLELACKLINGAYHGALAAIDPTREFPHISRVQLSTDGSGNLITLVSSLSSHTKCIVENPKCSLLIGEPGKGDPLAHPRISINIIAEKIERESDEHLQLRKSHLAHYPKAALYVDFTDFSFFRLVPQDAALNGGFGKAYQLTAEEIRIAMAAENSE